MGAKAGGAGDRVRAVNGLAAADAVYGCTVCFCACVLDRCAASRVACTTDTMRPPSPSLARALPRSGCRSAAWWVASQLSRMPVTCPRNENFAKLSAGYLFPVINKKKQEFLAANPGAKLISLGIGDTTHPLPAPIDDAMANYAKGMATLEGYEGYDPKSEGPLKEKIASQLYKGMIKPDEVFVSDGSKCDLGRLQFLFGSKAKVATQDPAYPVYVDSSVIAGRSGMCNPDTKQYDGITYMPCTPDNGFYPDISVAKDCDILMFCNPNNPTGACATKAQLTELVNFCRTNGQILVFDSAYSAFITDPNCPKSIYEIEGAKECAIETSSFSKLAGFTGAFAASKMCMDVHAHTYRCARAHKPTGFTCTYACGIWCAFRVLQLARAHPPACPSRDLT